MELNRTTTVPYGGVAALLVLCAVVAACARPARPPVEPAPVPAPHGIGEPLPADAQRFQVVPSESLITILVYRAGTLAKAGHNHVVASRDLSGSVIFTPQVERGAFALRMPLGSLSVDEPELRRAAGEEFSAPVPESARVSTRRNMLSAAVLEAERFPYLTIVSQKLEPAAGGALATVQITVRDATRVLTLPVRYEQKGTELLADGEFALRQTDLGLQPFSALLGALQVQDEMRVRFRVLARAD
jgi:polyisoprenoid-binding protein YceI